MSDGAAKLACSGCFLGRPRSCLTQAKDAEGAKGAESTSAGDIPIDGTSAEGTSV